MTASRYPREHPCDTVEAASRRLIYEVTLSEDQGNFAFDKAAVAR